MTVTDAESQPPTPLDDLSKLAERIENAIREIPAQNPAYISAVASNLSRVLDRGLLREIAKVAADEAATAIRSLTERADAEMLRVKACEHIAEGTEGWERLRNECPSTAAVAALRDKADALTARVGELEAENKKLEANPYHAYYY